MEINPKLLYNIFEAKLLDDQPDGWGVLVHCSQPTAIGFATTLTPALIHQAIAKDINLLVTHHDSWEFMREERKVCLELLAQHNISHVWCHDPLDVADFGTAASLLNVMGCKVIGAFDNGNGRVGALPKSLPLSEVINILNDQLLEEPCRKYEADRLVTRIACMTGAGSSVNYLAEALAFDIDLYVTGETSLYLCEYASFHNISVLIYSHNYTEIFGTQGLAIKIADILGIKKVIRLEEPHF